MMLAVKKSLCKYSVNTHGPGERISKEQFTGKKWAWALYIDQMYMNTSIPKSESYSTLLKRNSSSRR